MQLFRLPILSRTIHITLRRRIKQSKIFNITFTYILIECKVFLTYLFNKIYINLIKAMIIRKAMSLSHAVRHLSQRLSVPHCLYSYQETKAILSALCYQEILTAEHPQNEPFTCLQHRLVQLTNQYMRREPIIDEDEGTTDRTYDKQAVDEIIAMFSTGVYLNTLVFGQDRGKMEDLSNRNKRKAEGEKVCGSGNADKEGANQKINAGEFLIDFRPTVMATQQIFNHFSSNNYKQSLIQGFEGISKTLSAILYHRLSESINTYLYNNERPLKQFYRALSVNDESITPPQKLIYWPFNHRKISVASIMENIMLQCPQIKDDQSLKSIVRETLQTKSQANQHLRQFCERVGNLYRLQDIGVTVFIDEINTVTSAFRDFNDTIINKNIRLNKLYKELPKLEQSQNIGNRKMLIDSLKQKLQRERQQLKETAQAKVDSIEHAYQISKTLRQLGEKVIFSSSMTIEQGLLFQPSFRSEKTLRLDSHGFHRQYIDLELQQKGNQWQFVSMIVLELDRRLPEFSELYRLISKDGELQQQKLLCFKHFMCNYYYLIKPYYTFLSISQAINDNNFERFKLGYIQIKFMQLEGKHKSDKIIKRAKDCIQEFIKDLDKSITKHSKLLIRSKLMKDLTEQEDCQQRDLIFRLLQQKSESLIDQKLQINKVELRQQQLYNFNDYFNQRSKYDHRLALSNKGCDSIKTEYSTFQLWHTETGTEVISYTLNLRPQTFKEIIRGEYLDVMREMPRQYFDQDEMYRQIDKVYNSQNYFSQFEKDISKQIMNCLSNKIEIKIKNFQGDQYKFSNSISKIPCPMPKDHSVSTPFAFLFLKENQRKTNTINLESADVIVDRSISYIENRVANAIEGLNKLLHDCQSKTQDNTSDPKIVWTHYFWLYNEQYSLSPKYLLHPRLSIVILDLKTLSTSQDCNTEHRESTTSSSISNLDYMVEELNVNYSMITLARE